MLFAIVTNITVDSIVYNYEKYLKEIDLAVTMSVLILNTLSLELRKD